MIQDSKPYIIAIVLFIVVLLCSSCSSNHCFHKTSKWTHNSRR